jgi:hypothetical protein
MNRLERAMTVISLTLGSGFVFGTAYVVHRTHVDEFFFNRARAQGEVVENRRSSTARSIREGLPSRHYLAVVRFTVPGKGDVTMVDWIAMSPESFSVGQSVAVYYDPNNPGHAMIDRGWKNFLLPGIPGAMGVLMLLGGVQRIRKSREVTAGEYPDRMDRGISPGAGWRKDARPGNHVASHTVWTLDPTSRLAKVLMWMMVNMGASALSRFRERVTAIANYVDAKGYVLLNPSVTTLAALSNTDLVTSASAGALRRATDGITDIDPFNSGVDSSELAFIATLGGKEVTIFSFSARTSDGAGLNYRVAKIRSAGLPRFSLGSHSAVEKAEKLVDYLTNAPDMSLDQGDFPDFFKRHWMEGPDAAPVYGFLTPTKLRFLESAIVGGIVASNGEYLVYYESEGRELQVPEELDRFIGTVGSLVANLF